MAFQFQSILRAFRARSNPTEIYEEDSNADPACDRAGRVWTIPGVGPQTAPGGFTYQAIPADDTAVVSAVPATLTDARGFIDAAVAANLYVQIHNKAAALVLGDVPVFSFLLPVAGAGQSFGPWTPSRGGRRFTTGITYGVSSTRDTYTASVTPIFIEIEGYIG